MKLSTLALIYVYLSIGILGASEPPSTEVAKTCFVNTASPTFEVATVKPAGTRNNQPIGLYNAPGGRVLVGSSTLRELIQYSFNVQSFQVLGASGWMDNTRYDVVGLSPENSVARHSSTLDLKAPISDEQREMLRALVCKRFKLDVEVKAKRGTILSLVQHKPAAALVKAHDTLTNPYMVVNVFGDGNGNGELIASNASMDFLASRLSRYLLVPVRNDTRISGTFDFDVRPSADSDIDLTTEILAGVRELGLKLVSTKGLVDSLSIIHAEEVHREE